MAAEDAFERAAKREQEERLREKTIESSSKSRRASRRGTGGGRRYRYGGYGMGAALVVFLFPYAIWAAVRALGFEWGNPTIPKSILDFFFGSILFAAATGWILFLTWVWLIDRNS